MIENFFEVIREHPLDNDILPNICILNIPMGTIDNNQKFYSIEFQIMPYFRISRESLQLGPEKYGVYGSFGEGIEAITHSYMEYLSLMVKNQFEGNDEEIGPYSLILPKKSYIQGMNLIHKLVDDNIYSDIIMSEILNNYVNCFESEYFNIFEDEIYKFAQTEVKKTFYGQNTPFTNVIRDRTYTGIIDPFGHLRNEDFSIFLCERAYLKMRKLI